ncbi:hypothetical protein Pmani_002638 [Petrolisthes manimaculis]|uniref:Uncharacterized protein n=1 Tax=Petrolisthes manimaculis TaxID=1843537 RepID=A0AAE1UJ74_9EUCA|nr:hypothetical protein Pmani_002638 [Petrolisthes manimaculis]
MEKDHGKEGKQAVIIPPTSMLPLHNPPSITSALTHPPPSLMPRHPGSMYEELVSGDGGTTVSYKSLGLPSLTS